MNFSGLTPSFPVSTPRVVKQETRGNETGNEFVSILDYRKIQGISSIFGNEKIEPFGDETAKKSAPSFPCPGTFQSPVHAEPSPLFRNSDEMRPLQTDDVAQN